MNLYLFNQTRNRDLDEYIRKLHIGDEDFMQLNQPDKHLLIIGGGCSLLGPQFRMQTVMRITNIDLAPPFCDMSERITDCSGDFTQLDVSDNQYDEIWALYSLPLYAPDKEAVYLFLIKAIMSLKSGGKLRFFPVEFDNSLKKNTKDADYDMTTMECTNHVLDALELIRLPGIQIERIVWDAENKNNGLEETVIVSVDANDVSKQKKERLNGYLKDFSSHKDGSQKTNVYIVPPLSHQESID